LVQDQCEKVVINTITKKEETVNKQQNHQIRKESNLFSNAHQIMKLIQEAKGDIS